MSDLDQGEPAGVAPSSGHPGIDGAACEDALRRLAVNMAKVEWLFETHKQQPMVAMCGGLERADWSAVYAIVRAFCKTRV